jgi:hypothetical protein
LAGELKAIRDKRERFFSKRWLGGMKRSFGDVAREGASGWWDESTQRGLASGSCLRPEGPEDDEDVYDVGRDLCSGSAALRSSGTVGW